MINYERLFEIAVDAERERCNILCGAREFLGRECDKEKCKECVMEALRITEDEYTELVESAYMRQDY